MFLVIKFSQLGKLFSFAAPELPGKFSRGCIFSLLGKQSFAKHASPKHSNSGLFNTTFGSSNSAVFHIKPLHLLCSVFSLQELGERGILWRCKYVLAD
ncbi:hypothetical protein CEXT_162961 [Caerostris extrusa]|uniref:Uncharacterized protein n=1 Tax=Caerostris extrusa TaxID=172846 RepID=A0AAV4WTU6_CAEEX|nr:hypothetical protein CEXT_162961 [Caerostris extrusa]